MTKKIGGLIAATLLAIQAGVAQAAYFPALSLGRCRSSQQSYRPVGIGMGHQSILMGSPWSNCMIQSWVPGLLLNAMRFPSRDSDHPAPDTPGCRRTTDTIQILVFS